MSEAIDTTTTGTTGTTAPDPKSSSETTSSTGVPATTGATSTASDPKTADTPTDAATAKTTATGADVPWQDNLAGDLKTDPLFRNYKTVDDLAKAHAHLTKLRGATAAELLKIPSKPRDQDPDAWAAFDTARGVPADPKEYQIELAPEAAADTPELANVLRELGGKAKFDNTQMAAVIETLNALGKTAAETEARAQEAETKETQDALTKEWGAAAEGNRRAIGKLMRDALGGQIDDAAMADLEGKLGSNLTMLRVLAYAVGKMAEPGAPEGADGGRTTPATQLTPAAATAALNAFYADPGKRTALNDRNHPQHKAALDERAGLLAMQRGEKRPDQPRA